MLWYVSRECRGLFFMSVKEGLYRLKYSGIRRGNGLLEGGFLRSHLYPYSPTPVLSLFLVSRCLTIQKIFGFYFN